MISLSGDCFNALYLKLLKIAVTGSKNYQSSRVGSVINLGQAYLEIMPDDPRLIFLNNRKINPVFAILEGAWVLSGCDKLEPLLNELPSFGRYSDDGETLNGAYGSRLRNYFGFDQLNEAIAALKNNFHSRRIVLTMFSPSDLKNNSLDIPCNTEIFLKVVDGALDITVLNRSNDIYLGLPYNVFVFGLLQKHIALEVGLNIGIQRHFSDCFHLYEKDMGQAKCIVGSNAFEEVSKVSKKFNWGYTDAILENFQEILKREYDQINDSFLAEFLKKYNRESRLLLRDSNALVLFDDFYGFLAYQCYIPIGCEVDDNKYWLQLRELMMNAGVKQKFEHLGVSPRQDIAKNIIEFTAQLKGQLCVLKQIIDKKAGPFGFKSYESEELALRVILLCLVWTTLDPYTINTSIGTMQIDEIKAAALLLNIPVTDLGPLCLVENELFEALSGFLNP